MDGLTTTSSSQTVGAGVGIVTLIIYLAVIVVTIIAYWKLFTKAGKPGWHSIIPFLNFYDMFEIAGMNGWLFLLLFVPIANIIIAIMWCLNLAKAFGKGTGFAIGLIFLEFIFILILAFGSAKYIGKQA